MGNVKPTLLLINFFQFLSHISELSSAKSFIISFITERGLKQFLKPMLQAKMFFLVYVKANNGSELVVFVDSTYHNL